MRNKALILLAACLSAFWGQALLAGPVTREKAIYVAGKIFSSRKDFKRTSGPGKIVWDGDAGTEQPALYVITHPDGGFVIISGDDNAVPVLAVSETGSFEADDMPDNVRWWMEQMQEQVRSTQTQSEKARNQWARLLGTKDDDPPLDENSVTDKQGYLTPEWDQGKKDPEVFGQDIHIYNKFCPKDKQGRLCVTGCVATSIAEVMTVLSGLYPEEMPSSPTGTITAYSVPNNYVAAATYNNPYILGNTAYDWENLRTLTGKEAIRQALNEGKTDLLDNLAHLMADCGAIMHAQYSYDGTGAYSEDIPANMASHFFMSKRARIDYASNFTKAQWTRLLKEELVRHPVLYSGRTTDNQEGHAFVFDGFGRLGDDDVFHVNFGWRGLCNGYYYFDYLKTDENEVWERGCDAIFDFTPDKSQVTQAAPFLKLWAHTSQYASYSGILVSTPITPGSSFSPTIGSIKNTGNSNYNGNLRAYLRKKDGTLVQIGETSMSIQAGGSWNTSGYGWYGNHLSCTIPSGTAYGLGDCIALYYTTGGNPIGIEPLPYDDDGTVLGTIPLVPTAFIQTEESYHVNDSFRFCLKNYDTFYAGTVWTITEPDGTVIRKKQAYDAYRLTKSGKYRIEAAIAPSDGADFVENVVVYINVTE